MEIVDTMQMPAIGNLNELFAALSKAQMEMTNAEKNVDNAYLKSKYADLASVMDAARPHLAKNGLAVIQRMVTIEGDLFLQTILGHASGQSIESMIKVEVKESKDGKTNYMHALGSSLSYLRRYSYAALVGVAVGTNDDDGNDSMPTGYRPEKKSGKSPVVEYISKEEAAEIEELIGDDEELRQDFLAKGRISKIEFLEKGRFGASMFWLEARVKETQI